MHEMMGDIVFYVGGCCLLAGDSRHTHSNYCLLANTIIWYMEGRRVLSNVVRVIFLHDTSYDTMHIMCSTNHPFFYLILLTLYFFLHYYFSTNHL